MARHYTVQKTVAVEVAQIDGRRDLADRICHRLEQATLAVTAHEPKRARLPVCRHGIHVAVAIHVAYGDAERLAAAGLRGAGLELACAVTQQTRDGLGAKVADVKVRLAVAVGIHGREVVLSVAAGVEEARLLEPTGTVVQKDRDLQLVWRRNVGVAVAVGIQHRNAMRAAARRVGHRGPVATLAIPEEDRHRLGVRVAGDEVQPAIAVEVRALARAHHLVRDLDQGLGGEDPAAVVEQQPDVVGVLVDHGDVRAPVPVHVARIDAIGLEQPLPVGAHRYRLH